MSTDGLRELRREQDDLRVDLLADPRLDDADVAQVFDSLLGRRPRRHVLDGDRSQIFPTLGTRGLGGLKIKGAGYRGGRVLMERRHDKPYPLPRYDAEGAATLDAAKDHGRAPAGGMSYQQARHEFTVSRYLHQRGLRVFPALGYGAMRRNGLASWFCVLDWPPAGVRDWFTLMRERAAVERVATSFGETQRELGQHRVYLVLSGLVEFEGVLVRKDFHTAHVAGFDDSFLARLSYYLFDVNFILAHMVHDQYVPDVADHRACARTAYLRALIGQDPDPSHIDPFKKLLVELKYADWEMSQRMDRLAADPIGRLLLQRFLDDSGERALFGELPKQPASAGAGEAGRPPIAAQAIASPRRFRWFGRRR